MKEFIAKLKQILHLDRKPSRKIRRKTRAQSMVEFALLLPILLTLFIGMVEFGFMINTYLSLTDATRQAAREYSNSQPFISLSPNVDNMNFYTDCAQVVIDTLAPPDDPLARQIVMDWTMDDILVSVISVDVDTATDPDTISTITRYPSGETNFSVYQNFPVSPYDDVAIETYMTANGTIPVPAGLLIVEVYYSYESTLGITTPFIKAFAPGGHVMLYASTIMPLVAVRPH